MYIILVDRDLNYFEILSLLSGGANPLLDSLKIWLI